jgi:hypothetical protein
MTQKNNYGLNNIGYTTSSLQSVSLAELRNSFQTFSQAEQKQTDVSSCFTCIKFICDAFLGNREAKKKSC